MTFLKETEEFYLFNGKQKQANYQFAESTFDEFGTRVDWYRKHLHKKPQKSLKLYFVKPEMVLKETADLCDKCQKGYIIYHPVKFRNKTEHIQAICNVCHRFHCYISQTGFSS